MEVTAGTRQPQLGHLGTPAAVNWGESGGGHHPLGCVGADKWGKAFPMRLLTLPSPISLSLPLSSLTKMRSVFKTQVN